MTVSGCLKFALCHKQKRIVKISLICGIPVNQMHFVFCVLYLYISKHAKYCMQSSQAILFSEFSLDSDKRCFAPCHGGFTSVCSFNFKQVVRVTSILLAPCVWGKNVIFETFRPRLSSGLQSVSSPFHAHIYIFSKIPEVLEIFQLSLGWDLVKHLGTLLILHLVQGSLRLTKSCRCFNFPSHLIVIRFVF